MQVSKRSAGSVALSKVGGGEDGAEGGGGDQLLPDQVGAGEALPDEAVKLIWDQVGQEQFQESARKLSPLLKQGRKISLNTQKVLRLTPYSRKIVRTSTFQNFPPSCAMES